MPPILKEPLVHFLLGGILIFAIYQTVAPEAPAEPQANEIVITDEDVNRLTTGFEAMWRRPPTDQEVSGLVEDLIREEVFVREALLLGFNEGDAIIRRRLRQKMEFLLQSTAEAIDPGDTELQSYLAENIADFTAPGTTSFEQVFLGESADQSQIDAALTRLNAGADPASEGQRSLLPARLDKVPPTAVDGGFGRGMQDSLSQLPTGTWAGPVRSGYGVHLVRVTGREDPRQPDLGDIRENVLRAWQAETGQQIVEEQFSQYRDRYEVTLPPTVVPR